MWYSSLPSSGAEYAYFMEAFGPFSAYMFSWVSTMIIKPSQVLKQKKEPNLLFF